MKTVSGAVLSSKPVSLSKAAKILSKFASADNGASPAYVHYLKRASESFEEVVQLHRDLRASAPEHKSSEIRSSIREEAVNSAPNFGDVEANGVVDGERHELGLNGRRDEVKKKKKKEGKKGRKDSSGDGRGNGDVGVSKEPIEVANGGLNGVKKDKKTRSGSEEIADSREGGKQSKKRKSEEISAENGEVNGSAEKRLQHKKRKKSKGGVQV